MGHHHHQVKGKNLFITILLNIIITISQVIGGIVSGSLALLSDALHNFSDVLALIIAYAANRLAAKEHTHTKTFGFKRAEVLSALFNTSILIGIAIYLIIESVEKLASPQAVSSIWVIGLGLLSIVLNALSLLLIKDDAHNNMNIKAAYLHLLTDVMTSVAVVLGGILIYFYELYWIDPLISILIALYLIGASWKLIKSSTAVLMQFVPAHIDLMILIQKVEGAHKEIKNIHHIHLWQLDDHHIHLEAHLDFHSDLTIDASSQIIDKLQTLLDDEFGINHAIFQCEYDRCDNKSVVLS